ncbi:MAG: hypothetical protein QOG10_471 [Kribbellaceae bacterium]|jgi:hypothetical protein|nr:hypothetical protein [Kribbellaceae bacterium]
MDRGVKTIRYAALVATAGLVLTGCGNDSTAGAGGSPTTPASSTPTTSQQAWPLTVTRDGGFAGFSDRVVVSADGTTSVRKRGGAPSRCRLDTSLLTSITDAVKAIDWASLGVTKPTVKHPDDMIIAVAADGGLARLEDPRVKPLVTPVGKLLTETTAPPEARKLCKPA